MHGFVSSASSSTITSTTSLPRDATFVFAAGSRARVVPKVKRLESITHEENGPVISFENISNGASLSITAVALGAASFPI